MINPFSFILFIYVAVRLIFPLPIGVVAKVCASAIILLISLKHLIFMHFFGGLASPELPRLAIMMAGWLYVTLVFVFIFLLLRDILGIVVWIGKRAGYAIAIPLTPLQIAGIILILAFACSTFALYGAIRHPDVKKVEVTLKNLPKELDGLSIVQVTDLHASAFHPEDKIRAIVESVNQLKPDLILLTGDIMDGTVSKREKDVAPLKALKAKYGVFGSAGNHEYYSGFDAWQKKLSELGIHMLYNSHVVLTIHRKPLVLAGVTDSVAAQFGKAVPNISAALQDAPPGVTRILMAHRPQGAKVHANAGVDLQLSGHTHGGQIIGLNQIVARFNENMLAGWYDIDDMKLYISTGISLWNGFPARLGVPSEITLVVLHAA